MLYDQPIWEMIPKQVLLLLIFQLERNINVMVSADVTGAAADIDSGFI